MRLEYAAMPWQRTLLASHECPIVAGKFTTISVSSSSQSQHCGWRDT